MTRAAPRPDGIPAPRFPYSPVIVSDDLVFTAGQVAADEAGDTVPGSIEEQTRMALDNVERCLSAAGCSLDDVVRVGAFLADLGDFPGYNRVYAERFSVPYPARTTVGARLPDGILVEIEAIARRPS